MEACEGKCDSLFGLGVRLWPPDPQQHDMTMHTSTIHQLAMGMGQVMPQWGFEYSLIPPFQLPMGDWASWDYPICMAVEMVLARSLPFGDQAMPLGDHFSSATLLS